MQVRLGESAASELGTGNHGGPVAAECFGAAQALGRDARPSVLATGRPPQDVQDPPRSGQAVTDDAVARRRAARGDRGEGGCRGRGRDGSDRAARHRRECRRQPPTLGQLAPAKPVEHEEDHLAGLSDHRGKPGGQLAGLGELASAIQGRNDLAQTGAPVVRQRRLEARRLHDRTVRCQLHRKQASG